jgi:pyruvate-formate lyase
VQRGCSWSGAGTGRGTIYSDDAIVPALVAAGVPLESARNYANDGCTEVAIDGESGISFVQMEAMKALELALFNGEANPLPGTPHGRYIYAKTASHDLQTTLRAGYRSGDFAAITSYEEFYAAFLDQYFNHLDAAMDSLCQRIRQSESDSVSSPFMAGTFPKTLSTGRDPLRGGFTVPCYSVFSGSLPTVADCLAAIRTVVFEDRAASPGELLQALRDDFVGHEHLRARCVRAPKFGNDDDYVDAIASDLATRFCARVEAHPTPSGAPFWPALYTFRFNDFAKVVGATPDGRRWGDPLAEHYSPTPGRALSGPAAVIRSAAKGPLSRACGSSIFHVSLARSVAPETQSGRDRVRQLVTSALSLGVAVMNVAVYDVDALRAAKREPERFSDLIVRVWGFSARFVDLSSDMQNHIIEGAVSAE